MDIQRIVRGFFWVAFAVFLLASIPHVAYFFRAFEPAGGWWHWFVAYCIALSIDVTTFLLSLTAAQLMRRKAERRVIASVWVFVLLLAALSWGMNWEYAYQFSSGMLARPEHIGLVSQINPIIASCFQALAIAYTWISDKLATSNEQPVKGVCPVVESTQPCEVLEVESEQCKQGGQKQLTAREQIVLLLTEGKRCTEIADIVGKSKSYVSQVSKQVGKGTEK